MALWRPKCLVKVHHPAMLSAGCSMECCTVCGNAVRVTKGWPHCFELHPSSTWKEQWNLHTTVPKPRGCVCVCVCLQRFWNIYSVFNWSMIICGSRIACCGIHTHAHKPGCVAAEKPSPLGFVALASDGECNANLALCWTCAQTAWVVGML